MTADSGEEKGGGSLWGGRFSGSMDPRMVPLNRSLGVDGRLWAEDIRGSRAWAAALGHAGVLTADEVEELDEGLVRLHDRFSSHGLPEGAEDEDIHSLVERLLFEEVGPVAGKLHTGRSRNDQVATDFRLWGMAAADRVCGQLHDAIAGVLQLAESGVEVILPGFTHLQQGQPVRAAHWALSHAWPLRRDWERFRAVRRQASTLPLGSGAIAGCPFPVNRERLAEALGFDRISPNSIDAVSDRDWAVEFALAGALLGTHLSRLGEDLVLFTSREFGYLRLSDGFSTGSSLMPQKRNPDAAELIRGRSGRLQGALQSLLTLLKGLPSGYNRDLQEDKAILFEVSDLLDEVLPVVAGAVAEASFQPDRIADRMDSQMLATDLADHLVREGVPFRTTHELVGRLVRSAEEQGVPLADLPSARFREVHEAFGDDPRSLFDFERSVEARDVPGGTARVRVLEQIAQLRDFLANG